MNSKDITKVSGAIITSYTNLFFLEEISRLNIVRHTVKKNLNRTIEDLKQIETDYFTQVDKIDKDNLADKLVSNKITFIDYILNAFDFNDFCKMQEVCYAFKLDRQRVTGITDKILRENQNK